MSAHEQQELGGVYAQIESHYYAKKIAEADGDVKDAGFHERQMNGWLTHLKWVGGLAVEAEEKVAA